MSIVTVKTITAPMGRHAFCAAYEGVHCYDYDKYGNMKIFFTLLWTELGLEEHSKGIRKAEGRAAMTPLQEGVTLIVNKSEKKIRFDCGAAHEFWLEVTPKRGYVF